MNSSISFLFSSVNFGCFILISKSRDEQKLETEV